MSIIRIKKRENPYVQIDKRPLEDDRLSWRAKGIFAYLLSKPDGWKVNIKDIWAKGTEGRNAVQVCMRELEKFGYAQLVFIKGDAGKIVGSEWVIIEEPEMKIAETPETGNPTNRQSGSRLINSNNEVLSNNKGEREAQAPNSHSQPIEPFEPSNNPLQVEEKKQEKKGAPGAAAEKEPRDLLLDWSNEQLPTIQSWYERAYRKFSQQDLESRVDDFLAVYGTHENYGIRVQVEQDPLKFFRGRFQLFLKNQDKFERPKPGEKAKSRILDTPNRNYEREPLF